MSGNEALDTLISDFLSERRTGNSDLAPVSKKDWIQLHNIINLLLKTKFEEDCDGYLPLSYNLTNRHTDIEVYPPTVPLKNSTHKARRLINLIGWATNLLKPEAFDAVEQIDLKDVDVKLTPYRVGSQIDQRQNTGMVRAQLDFEKRTNNRLYYKLKERCDD